MAIVNFINRPKSQIGSGLSFVLRYVMREDKTVVDGRRYVTGVNCMAESALLEFQNTKRLFGKTDGRQYYHFVQSFSPDDSVTPEVAHEIALRFVQESEKFRGFEVVVATHCDRDHIHSHFVLNSVCAATGKKFHISQKDVEGFMEKSDELCRAYGLPVLEPFQSNPVGGMGGREYRTAERGLSWKLRLANVIDDCMRRTRSKEEFRELLALEGYGIRWEPNRKYLTYTVPGGMKCRDNKLHELKYLKARMEIEFRIREEIFGGAESPEQAARFDNAGADGRAHRRDSSAGAEAGGPAHVGAAVGADPGGEVITETGWERERAALLSALAGMAPAGAEALADPAAHGSYRLVDHVLGLAYGVAESFPDPPGVAHVSRPAHMDSKEWQKLTEKKAAHGQKPGGGSTENTWEQNL